MFVPQCIYVGSYCVNTLCIPENEGEPFELCCCLVTHDEPEETVATSHDVQRNYNGSMVSSNPADYSLLFILYPLHPAIKIHTTPIYRLYKTHYKNCLAKWVWIQIVKPNHRCIHSHISASDAIKTSERPKWKYFSVIGKILQTELVLSMWISQPCEGAAVRGKL